MSSFTRATFEPTGQTRLGRAVYAAAETFWYEIGFLGSGLRVEVAKGDRTDGPSVPFWALPVFPVGRLIKASAVHDKLRADLRFTKLEGDAIFLAAMQAEGAPAWQREVAFLLVRLNRNRG